MDVEATIRIDVKVDGHEPMTFSLSEKVARAMRDKLNEIFGPDRVVVEEFIPSYIPALPPIQVPDPAPSYPWSPFWGQPTITCGQLKG